jgi:hypothetical protein
MDHSKGLWAFLTRLKSDYSDYGGEVERWADPNENDADCSSGCRFACYLEGSGDWLVCANPASPRAGLLTWEHQAGRGCWVPEPDEEELQATIHELRLCIAGALAILRGSVNVGGGHHKQYVIDQAVRALMSSEDYGALGPDWDKGIAP